MRPKAPELCSKPYCRAIAEIWVHEDPKTGKVSPEYAPRGYCRFHDEERAHQAMIAWEEAHKDALEANKQAKAEGVITMEKPEPKGYGGM